MSYSDNWKEFWDNRYDELKSDFYFGLGRNVELHELSTRELLSFIDPQPDETIFDAGCGTGVNILLLHKAVKRITGIDYAQGAIDRCERLLGSHNIKNASVMQGSISQIPLADQSVDKTICMSVLQYIDDSQARQAFQEFRRISKKNGILVLHVKNLSSIQMLSIWLIKKIKRLLGRSSGRWYVRPFQWYITELRSAGFQVVDYNSSSPFIIDKMPQRLVVFLQKLELRNHDKPFFRMGLIRRHGADLKIKARAIG